MADNELVRQLKIVGKSINILSSLILTLIIVIFFIPFNGLQNENNNITSVTTEPIKEIYNTALLDNSKDNLNIKYGYELFQNTPKYIGPKNGKATLVYAGNNLACTNCHLQAGTKTYSGLLVGISKRFPQFRGRENKMGSLKERINGCMERSMNGKALPLNGNEMEAFISYLTWLSRLAPADGKLKGVGYAAIKIPERAIDLENGKQIFVSKCAVCHGENGKGIKLNNSFTYQYPPLWGDDSFNNGAGMTRVITAAKFIKSNMPLGATFKNPLLTDEESYDVAGYISQQKRPQKTNLESDFPDLRKKPVSTPYPPYADDFSILQHQKGPFQAIINFYKKRYNIIKTK